MKITKLLMTALLLLSCATIHAQFGDRLGKAIKKSAEDATVRKSEEKTDEVVSKGIDKVTDPNTYKGDGEDKDKAKDAGKPESEEDNSQSSDVQAEKSSEQISKASEKAESSQQQPKKAAEQGWAKFDFVTGNEIIFDDHLTGEQNGEFPSKWELLTGVAEITKLNSDNVIWFKEESSTIYPMMKEKEYLADAFTIEMDYRFNDGGNTYFELDLYNSGKEMDSYGNIVIAFNNNMVSVRCDESDAGPYVDASGEYKGTFDPEDFNHASISFNKRALKVYINDQRVVNIPNARNFPKGFSVGNFHVEEGAPIQCIKNIRVAQGAVPLYDKFMTDGKIITYGITFDVGKASLKPESMGTINDIFKIMKEHPEIKFRVEGHTDSTGDAASNQKLSEARAKAVADKLIEMGIDRGRLSSAGKGQNNPISGNDTPEGKAKNRRVEFVKS